MRVIKENVLLVTNHKFRRVEQIGNCTLYLGDCLEIIPDIGRVGSVITDPPYSQAYQAKWGAAKRRDGVKMDTSLPFSGVDLMLPVLVEQVARSCEGWGVFFTNVEGIQDWLGALSTWKPDNVLAWVKPDCTPRLNGEGPARGFEPAVTCWFGEGRRKWNSGGKRGVYTHLVNSGRYGGHPTEKPIPLMRELLADFTEPGEIVLDPFMGGGTTGVACAKMDRSFIGIEIDESYFDIACKRIEAAYKQPDLFVDRRAEPAEQVTLEL